MTVAVLRADARDLPLPDASVDLVVTSPPYFGLRSYTDGGEHYPGQIGSEGTPAEWLVNLVACTREWVRVLKPEGSIFVNLGDKYAAGHGGSSTEGNGVNLTVQRDRPAAQHWTGADSHPSNSRAVVVPGTRAKSLLGLPWRYALACMDGLGLILRAEIVWAKPNGLPESVTDRVRRSHEQVFHFTRLPRYFSAVDEIREPHCLSPGVKPPGSSVTQRAIRPGEVRPAFALNGREYNPLGKLPGSVWDIPSQPLTVPAHLGVDHFAAFPMELPRRVVLGWSPAGVCTVCGQGRRPVSVHEIGPDHQGRAGTLHSGDRARLGHARERKMLDGLSLRTITGYACACLRPDAPTVPAVVLDPFGGTGTTALVASVNGRHGITADLSADYCRLAAWRCSDPGERARAMQVPKPPPIPGGMDPLFGLVSP